MTVITMSRNELTRLHRDRKPAVIQIGWKYKSMEELTHVLVEG